jgi:hypothetical protein
MVDQRSHIGGIGDPVGLTGDQRRQLLRKLLE